MDFGRPEYVFSKRFTRLIKCSSTIPGKSYLFVQYRKPHDRGGKIKSYWRCCECTKIAKKERCYSNGATLHLDHQAEQEKIITNPEVGHRPGCLPLDNSTIQAKQMLQEEKINVQKGIKRPLEAYTAVCKNVTLVQDPELQNAIENSLPSFKKVRRSLYRCTEVSHKNITDHCNLPEEYIKTLRGRNADESSPYNGEVWNIHASEGLLVFSSIQDLDLLFKSKTWIGDGTFKVSPHNFQQLYTILAYGQFANEAIPCVFALMKNKNSSNYENLFEIIRKQIEQIFGGVGELENYLCDYEIVVMTTIKKVFPRINVRGCLFHFSQTLLRHLSGGILRYLREKENNITIWFGKVRSLALLPENLVHIAWIYVLLPQANLIKGMLDNNGKEVLDRFLQYFYETWLSGKYFPISQWNHFTNNGPRTTNHAEGYHSVLNRNHIKEMHPSLGYFLEKLQIMHNCYQQKVRRLQNGSDTPTDRNFHYAAVHKKILNAKIVFQNRTAILWPKLGNLSYNEFTYVCLEIENFLNYVRYLIG